MGPVNECAAVLDQWLEWNAAGCIFAPDGHDIFPELADWGLPVLALAGAADRMIAPPRRCQTLATAFGQNARFHLCTVETDREDFTHSRLTRSRNAQAHVWPRILRFWDDL